MKKTLFRSNIITYYVIAFGLIIIFLMFVPFMSFPVDIDAGSPCILTGFHAAFGGHIFVGVTGFNFKFSFMNFLTYVLVLVGIILAVLYNLGKIGKISNYVAIACFLIAGIFFFFVIEFTIPQVYYTKEYCTLGIGAILSGILSIISATLIAVKSFVLKK